MRFGNVAMKIVNSFTKAVSSLPGKVSQLRVCKNPLYVFHRIDRRNFYLAVFVLLNHHVAWKYYANVRFHRYCHISELRVAYTP